MLHVLMLLRVACIISCTALCMQKHDQDCMQHAFCPCRLFSWNCNLMLLLLYSWHLTGCQPALYPSVGTVTTVQTDVSHGNLLDHAQQ